MKLRFTSEEVEKHRDILHRRTPGRAISTKRQALAFVDAVGFCFAFKAEHSELPCLWHAACGMRDPVMPEHTHHDPGISFVWEMKDVLPAERKIYYGKLLRGRPTMVSLAYLPYFFVLSGRTGDKSEYRKMHSRGSLSDCALAIMESLADESPQTTKGLKLSTHRHTPGDRKEFDRAIGELQERMFLVKVAETDDPFSFIWAPFRDVFPEVIHAARRITLENARDILIRKYIENEFVASIEMIHRLFKWKKSEIVSSLARLEKEGSVMGNVRVDGSRHIYHCLVKGHHEK